MSKNMDMSFAKKIAFDELATRGGVPKKAHNKQAGISRPRYKEQKPMGGRG